MQPSGSSLPGDFVAVLAAVRGGEEDAFAELWRHYHPRLLRYLTLLVGQAADDVASETWISVIRDLDTFSGDERGFRTWLMTVARHRAVDWARRRDRNSALVEELGQTERPDSEPDPATVVIDRLSAREAVSLIGRLLPPVQAEAVILRVVVGLDVAEAADVMGKRSGTVRVLVHRGLRQLAGHFSAHRSGQRGRT